MRVQRNEGKRLRKENVSSEKLCGNPIKPTNYVNISAEIPLEADSYPYVFTLYVSTNLPGKVG
jgi:hypothetical protein